MTSAISSIWPAPWSNLKARPFCQRSKSRTRKRLSIRSPNWSSGCCNTKRFATPPRSWTRWAADGNSVTSGCQTTCPPVESILGINRSWIWKSGTLVSAFGRIMREAGGPPPTEVIYDDTPIHVYMQRIHGRLGESEKVQLVDLIEGGIHKSSLIGWFLATLELTRHHGAAVEQDENGDIYVVRTANYSKDLDVNEVDNYDADEFDAVNMPGRPR